MRAKTLSMKFTVWVSYKIRFSFCPGRIWDIATDIIELLIFITCSSSAVAVGSVSRRRYCSIAYRLYYAMSLSRRLETTVVFSFVTFLATLFVRVRVTSQTDSVLIAAPYRSYTLCGEWMLLSVFLTCGSFYLDPFVQCMLDHPW